MRNEGDDRRCDSEIVQRIRETERKRSSLGKYKRRNIRRRVIVCCLPVPWSNHGTIRAIAKTWSPSTHAIDPAVRDRNANTIRKCVSIFTRLDVSRGTIYSEGVEGGFICGRATCRWTFHFSWYCARLSVHVRQRRLADKLSGLGLGRLRVSYSEDRSVRLLR